MNYCTNNDIEIYANENGLTWALLDDKLKKKIIAKATLQISAYHNQSIDIYVPWQLGNEKLRQACILQSLFLVKGISVIESKELAQAYTNGELDDGVKIATANGSDLLLMVKSIIDNELIEQGVSRFSFERG